MLPPVERPLRVGIVGFGAIGRIHARALREVDGAEPVAATGRTTSVPDDLAEYGLDWCPTLDALLDRVDLVAICTPAGDHVAQATAALEAGTHAVVEKPPGMDPAGVRGNVELARRNGLLYAVISQHRLHPHARHIAEVIGSGALGRPILGELLMHWHRPQEYYEKAPWRRRPEHGGGSLANQGWHPLDLLRSWLGPVRRVAALAGTVGHEIPVEDTTVAALQFENGALGAVVTTTATPPGEPAELRLHFERGVIGLRDATIVRWDVPDGVPSPPAADRMGTGAADPLGIGIEGHRRQWADIIRAVAAGGEPTVTGEDSLRTLELVQAIYASAGQRDRPYTGGVADPPSTTA